MAVATPSHPSNLRLVTNGFRRDRHGFFLHYSRRLVGLLLHSCQGRPCRLPGPATTLASHYVLRHPSVKSSVFEGVALCSGPLWRVRRGGSPPTGMLDRLIFFLPRHFASLSIPYYACGGPSLDEIWQRSIIGALRMPSVDFKKQ